MNDWTIVAGYSLGGAMLVMMAIGIAFSAFMPALDRWSRRYFLTFFSILFLYAVVLFFDLIFYVDPDIAAQQKVVIILEYLFFSVLTPMPMPFLLHSCSESLKRSVPLRAVMALWGVFCLILVAAQFTDVIYYSTPDNQYFRGPLYALLMIPLALTARRSGMDRKRIRS